MAPRPPFLRFLIREARGDLLVGAGFAVLTVACVAGAPWAQAAARHLKYWWPYEILTGLFLCLYLVVYEEVLEERSTAGRRLRWLVGLYAALTVGVHLAMGIAIETLALSALFILPSYVLAVTSRHPRRRRRVIERGAGAFAVLPLSFFPAMILASLLVPTKVTASGLVRNVDGVIELVWGAVYYLLGALLWAGNAYLRRLDDAAAPAAPPQDERRQQQRRS